MYVRFFPLDPKLNLCIELHTTTTTTAVDCKFKQFFVYILD